MEHVIVPGLTSFVSSLLRNMIRPWSWTSTKSTLPLSIEQSEPLPQTPGYARRVSTMDTVKSSLLLSRFLNPLLACIHGTFAFCLFRHFLVRLSIYVSDEAVSLTLGDNTNGHRS